MTISSPNIPAGNKITPFTGWNRLETRPRQEQFSEALQAKIHDPLWMLGRQWQVGEFTGQDTGSGIFAKVQMSYKTMTGIGAYGQTPGSYDGNIPMEAMVESIPYNWSIKERLLMGKKWQKIMKATLSTGDYTTYSALFTSTSHPFAMQFPVPSTSMATEDNIREAAEVYCNEKLVNFLSGVSVSGLNIDGAVLYNRIKDNVAWSTNLATDFGGSPGATTISAQLVTVRSLFLQWMNNIYPFPDGQANWEKKQLEYQFDTYWPVDGSTQMRLTAKKYHQGHFDWYAFNQDTSTYNISSPYTADGKSMQLMIAQSGFAGMPSTRWWEFEDGKVNFCNLDGNSTDIAKIITTQFALVYQDDWFFIPYTIPVGSYAQVAGMVITDVFGVNTFVANYDIDNYNYSSGFQASNDWKDWRWLDISKSDTAAVSAGSVNNVKPAGTFVFLPVVNDILESDPVESVLFIRDELADMVWAIEKRVPNNMGTGWDGYDRANAYTALLKKIKPDTSVAVTPPADAKLSYELETTTIPENWIPFIPVRLPGSNRQIEFQRGAMPRIMAPYAPSMVRPQTGILSYGLSGSSYAPYYIYEEEIPRAGAIVETSIQRTRWYNGKTLLWVGRRKYSGRGEGNSGLAYDRLNDIPQ